MDSVRFWIGFGSSHVRSDPKKYPKHTKKTWKFWLLKKYDNFYLKFDPKTWKYPNFYLNIQNIFLKNLEFYLKPESITENSKKKRISKYQKHIWNTQIYIIYSKHFVYFGFPTESWVGSKLNQVNWSKKYPIYTFPWTRIRSIVFLFE